MPKLLLIAFDPADVQAGAGFAQTSGLPFDILLLQGEGAAGYGAQTVITTDLTVPPTAEVAGSIDTVGYEVVAAVSSMRSKDLLARLAGLMGAAMVTDVVSRTQEGHYVRPVVAGSMLATVEVLSMPVVITFRPAGFPTAESSATSEARSINLDAGTRVTRVSSSAKTGGRPDLTSATVIVSGGRPLGDKETFERVIGGLADRLGGAVGGTRAAVDSGIAPNEMQVGQTGKIVAPDLYIAAGISGSTQHMAGIKDSKVIVAINKDPEAPIFDVADIGLVADLFDAVPALTRLLEKP